MRTRRQYIKLIILSLARLLGLFALARLMTRHQLRILCYHGGLVGDEARYNPKLFCSADSLRRRMRWLQGRGFHFLSLDEAIGKLESRTPFKPLPAVVTFDDGWYSTFEQLLPVLSGMGIPSTLYLSTQQYQRGCPVPGVTVRYTIWKARRQPVVLGGFGGADGDYDLRQENDCDRLANAVTQWIVQSAHNRDAVCAALHRFGACLGVPPQALQLDTRRFDYLSEEEARQLAAHGCQVQLHGHVHHYPAGNAAAFTRDLQTCARVIADAGLPQPRHYCYPSGAFDTVAGEVLGRLGMRSATTCVPGLADAGTPRFYLPRFLDGESIHPLEFEAEMSGLLHLLRGVLRPRARSSPSGKLPLAPELAELDASAVHGSR
jgi:peptidoglycan/xylan/chitin deacetylase (PgdA/CDA1 family)